MFARETHEVLKILKNQKKHSSPGDEVEFLCKVDKIRNLHCISFFLHCDFLKTALLPAYQNCNSLVNHEILKK